MTPLPAHLLHGRKGNIQLYFGIFGPPKRVS